MNAQQKALLIRCTADAVHGLDELNLHLSRGWRVQHLTPMGGAGVGAHDDEPAIYLASLVIIERRQENETALMEEAAEETVESIIEEMVEGNGTSTTLDDDLTPPAV